VLSEVLTSSKQTVCGMSVVGSDWESLKRFNLAEARPAASNSALEASKIVADNGVAAGISREDTTPNVVQTDEATTGDR